MKKLTITIALLTAITLLKAQSKYELTFNARNPKESSSRFDYYCSVDYTYKLKKNAELRVKSSYERDNNIEYESFLLKYSYKYGYSKYYMDTEKNIEVYSSVLFFKLKDNYKYGLDVSVYPSETKISCYLAYENKYFNFEISFLDQVNSFGYEIYPEFAIFKDIKVGLDINGIYIDNEYKWNTGFKIIYRNE